MKLATLCYVEKENQYLMLHRVKKENDMHKGMWVGLGGKLEPGESPEECVVREVYEESGLQIKNPKLKGILTFPEFSQEGEDWYVFLFLAREFTGTLRPCPEGTLVWVDKDKLMELPMHEGDKHFLAWLGKVEGVFSAKFTYEQGVLKDCQMVAHV